MSQDLKPDVKPEGAESGHQSNEHINLKVMGQAGGSVIHFKIKRNTPFKKLITAYCERQGLQKSTIRFMFDGTPMQEDQTPNDLDMEDDDTIEVFQAQTGGF
ncbi:PREDICTED: small ubiquitin-related modifier 2-like [Amphimedon queenslandica]|uniref:Small ubiquitin-related modifier n=1 Tax=Amphimedon queenslandica TaxID=400682 RepID=A0A1X7UH15_AMPQE|nr:PREDICTED: small ubiquitin-related modifier 2-like [Amphimedon queenslandica]|eukprot:XP_003388064.1 PREDICTED: small ubiquitin-related modifier 2-like [Amphimedon queenslandica]